MKILYPTALLAFCMAAGAQADGNASTNRHRPEPDEEPIRYPSVAGTFYPAEADSLRAAIHTLLDQVKVRPTKGRIRALLAPHAGYVYSGGVAAHAFKPLIGTRYKTVVLIGSSHRESYYGASVYPRGRFRTPLGDVPINARLAKRLMDSSPLIFFRESPHLTEHSLETQIPFLQSVLGDFQLVPILLGSQDTEIARALAKSLSENVEADTLVIASSDLSHYPSYDDAKLVDMKTIQAVVSGDVSTLEKNLRQMERMGFANTSTFLCGEGALKTVMLYSQEVGARQIELLQYANSGDVTGSRQGVVGYASIAFSSDSPTERNAEQAEKEIGGSAEEQTALLQLARNTIKSYLQTEQRPALASTPAAWNQHLGAFVTLRKKGELRGCIGRFEPNQPLFRVVQEMAIAAATQDGRFTPVEIGELDGLTIEISVLSPLRKATWQEIELGKHGVQVSRGMRSGVFLPQVATETGWDLDTFMSQLCAQKAGLPPDAWKDPKTDLYLFTAQIFHEK